LEDYAKDLDDEAKDYLSRVRASGQHMRRLVDALLELSRMTRREIRREQVDLSAMAEGIVQELRKSQPERKVEFVSADDLCVEGDAWLLRIALENLLGNAWKFTAKSSAARIEFGLAQQERAYVYYVRDNGAGFEMAYADKLFGAFQRLHSVEEFPGTGIGLATVKRIVHRHGGEVWAEGRVGKGATFYFTL
jgi:light-regulated signal transduction histidine kinase (bacteriophytochrome)